MFVNLFNTLFTSNDMFLSEDNKVMQTNPSCCRRIHVVFRRIKKGKTNHVYANINLFGVLLF